MRCNYCEWHCDLGAENFGVCKMYYADGSRIRERFPNRWSSCAISRIESLPFYHVYPGSRSLAIGTCSCNFNCRYCSNAHVARTDPAEQVLQLTELTPEDIVRQSQKLKCQNIVFNTNEPTVSLQTLLTLRGHAARAGLPMGCLTNAYTTDEGTELLAAVFDFFNIGLKGLSPAFHKDYLGVRNVDAILRNIRTLAAIRHVEITTPVIQGVNDSDLPAIAAFLADIDPHIPWHVFRLLPEHEMKDAEYPDIERINETLKTARNYLAYVYFHNFVGSDWVNTICPSCGRDVIERISLGCGGDRLSRFHCEDNQCPGCGQEIRILGNMTNQMRG